MAVSAPRRLFTVDEYYRMAAAGVFKPGERIELLDGEIVPRNPIGSPHAWCVTFLMESLLPLVGRFRLIVQQPVRLHDQCEPEPDLAVLRRSAPPTRHPGPDDTLLIVEVADSSLRVDRGRKERIYSRARIPEYWIANLSARCIEIYREPSGRGYRSVTMVGAGETVSPLCDPDLVVEVDAVFGQDQGDGQAPSGSQE